MHACGDGMYLDLFCISVLCATRLLLWNCKGNGKVGFLSVGSYGEMCCVVGVIGFLKLNFLCAVVDVDVHVCRD